MGLRECAGYGLHGSGEGRAGWVHAAGFSVGDAAGLRVKEEPSGPRGWLGREKKLGLKKEGVDRARWWIGAG